MYRFQTLRCFSTTHYPDNRWTVHATKTEKRRKRGGGVFDLRNRVIYLLYRSARARFRRHRPHKPPRRARARVYRRSTLAPPNCIPRDFAFFLSIFATATVHTYNNNNDDNIQYVYSPTTGRHYHRFHKVTMRSETCTILRIFLDDNHQKQFCVLSSSSSLSFFLLIFCSIRKHPP